MTTAAFFLSIGWDWLLPVAFAPITGSFLGLVICRLPVGEGVVWGRSACPHCRRALSPRDLVPLLSWLLHRRRCRLCGGPIDWFYPAVELAALAVAVWAVAEMAGWMTWATTLFGWLLLTLAWIDQRHMLLPDALTLPLISAGLLVGLTTPEFEWVDHLIGAAGGLGGLYFIGALYGRFRGRPALGLGDAKLLAGIGAWVTWQGLAGVVLLAALSALSLVLLRRLSGTPMATADRLPLGPHLALAGWLVWLYGPAQLG